MSLQKKGWVLTCTTRMTFHLEFTFRLFCFFFNFESGTTPGVVFCFFFFFEKSIARSNIQRTEFFYDTSDFRVKPGFRV